MSVVLQYAAFSLSIILVTHTSLHADVMLEQHSGALDYKRNCANCHGTDGKGTGPMAKQLAVSPTDLTLLRKENGGSFPETAVYNIIDGRRVSDFHGQEMPIWGEQFLDIEGNEAAVEERISNIIDYLQNIQAD